MKKQRRRWYLKNRDKILAEHRASYLDQRERRLAYAAQYQRDNNKEIKQYQAEYRRRKTSRHSKRSRQNALYAQRRAIGANDPRFSMDHPINRIKLDAPVSSKELNALRRRLMQKNGE